jgi:uncharacterized protein (TIGR00251 family)
MTFSVFTFLANITTKTPNLFMSKIIKIKVIPRSSQNEIVGEMADGVLKVKLTTPPIDGKANEELIKLLAKHFSIAKNDIKILQGLKSKNKMVEIKK